MKFFSKETCSKLQKLGCVSKGIDFGALYIFRFCYVENNHFDYHKDLECKIKGHIPIFTIGDFLGDEAYALENCKKVFGEHTGDSDYAWCAPNYIGQRHELLGAADQEAFIVAALEGR